MKRLIPILALFVWLGCSTEPQEITVEQARQVIAKAEAAAPVKTSRVVVAKVVVDDIVGEYREQHTRMHWFVIDSNNESCEVTPLVYATTRIDTTRITCVWTIHPRLRHTWRWLAPY